MKEEDLSSVEIRDHALERFIERHKRKFGRPPKHPVRELRQSLRSVVEVRRRGKSRIFDNCAWRFALNMSCTRLITVFEKPLERKRPIVIKDKRLAY